MNQVNSGPNSEAMDGFSRLCQPLKWIPIIGFVVGLTFSLGAQSASQQPPNVVVIMTDDQGYGDFGFMGNPLVRTPHLDAMARRSGQMSQFYVSPVCAPTRACLMTGRYNYRTRCIDTYVGRAMMDPEEVTMAEVFEKAGYATGIFGKWHLGDNYPMRPMDQGFQQSLVHRGGGIGQPSDPIGAEGKYTDPVLLRNGVSTQYYGYCTDLYFSGALDFIDASVAEEQPFLIYLPMNCPHGPFNDAPKALYEWYRKQDLSNARFPVGDGHPLPKENAATLDKRARIFAMITNIDENVGRLFDRLRLLEQNENTIVVFLVDNGPNGRRYVAGMQGSKTSVYEGGVRSPLLFHWPARVVAGQIGHAPTAHYDLLPTLMEACGIKTAGNLPLDGVSFLGQLDGRGETLPNRNLFIQAHRGNQPVRYHNFMMRDDRWKLLHASGFGRENFEGEPRFELFDLAADPLERHDLAAERPDVVRSMKSAYDRWFDDVGKTRSENYAPPAIYVGDENENPVVLTRQDWRHVRGRPWAKDSFGHWVIDVRRAGTYQVRVHPETKRIEGQVSVQVGAESWTVESSGGKTSVVVPIQLKQLGRTQIQASYLTGDKKYGPHQLEVEWLE